MSKHINSLLCLGDSYTIGEGLPLYASFPYQLVQILRKRGHHFHAPEIVAKTGWTTFELAEFLIHHHLESAYDYVTLLIGVNNQYRGLPFDNFKEDAAFLLKKAVGLCVAHQKQVFVLSIPDWSVTPYAQGHDVKTIAQKIDSYNHYLQKLASQYEVRFIDITTHYRAFGMQQEALAADNLHPSSLIYRYWAEQLAAYVK
jgi:phospholipase/lecithinase/hemolysin